MYCWKCGMQVVDNGQICAHCGAHLYAQNAERQDDSSDKALGLLLPINVSGLAFAAGYLGLFSVLLVPAPIAIITGFLALKDIKHNPKKSGKGRAIFGIIMGSICSIGLTVLVVNIMLAQG